MLSLFLCLLLSLPHKYPRIYFPPENVAPNNRPKPRELGVVLEKLEPRHMYSANFGCTVENSLQSSSEETWLVTNYRKASDSVA